MIGSLMVWCLCFPVKCEPRYSKQAMRKPGPENGFSQSSCVWKYQQKHQQYCSTMIPPPKPQLLSTVSRTPEEVQVPRRNTLVRFGGSDVGRNTSSNGLLRSESRHISLGKEDSTTISMMDIGTHCFN